jgi:hypothetical protein
MSGSLTVGNAHRQFLVQLPVAAEPGNKPDGPATRAISAEPHLRQTACNVHAAAMRARLFAICALCFLSSACTGTSSSISVTSPTAVKCEVVVENGIADAAPADGMSGTLAIATNRDCTWTATTTAAWIAITSPTTGQGSGSLGYRVSANPAPAPRRGVVEVNNTQVPVVQEAAPCRYSVTPVNATVSPNGGDVSITIETLAGCAWTAGSPVVWISLPGNASGNASGTLTLTVAANSGTVPRTGSVTIGPQTVTIQQAAPSPNPDPTPAPTPAPTPTPTPPPAPCVFNISPTSNNVGSDASTGTIHVTAGSDCAWTATANANWLTITSGGSGSGEGSVEYRVAVNAGAARSATIIAAGKTFTIAQAAAPPPACTFSISPETESFAAAGGSGAIAVTSSANTCAWTAATSAPWISMTAGQSGTGNGQVRFTVAANTDSSSRTATIAVAGRTFTVTQAAAPPPPPPPCTFSISPTTQDVADTGSSGSVAVAASANTCAWTASANAAWLTVTGGASGTGNGTVAFAVAVNTAAARTGTLTIGGQTFTVSQAAPPPPPPPPCTFSISPATGAISSDGGSGSVTVTASAATCAWTATVNVDWLAVLRGSSGTGSDTVEYAVSPNLLESDRTGTITIAGQTFTVTQRRP